MTNKIIYKFTLLIMVALFLENCGAVKPKVPASALTKREANNISAVNNDSKKSNETQYVLKIETPVETDGVTYCLLYTSPSPRDKRQSRMPSSA